ncbi:predicted protein [Chaetomium globosum CBS 148.51]|uniref:Uncharacterized protein n=1 Tax=Chaetomium globosum (strain ATCC 6205 / CBS 148.51 / DSM 1962 / NBRC 6347 / NRRL 1970) TaxID=306901 RepID=Q2GZP0_CHAGB|nr:uncharacterized protein CHGG_05006 [Chaetomium globosum CBS 148.51]EAQ88387.1 predicted protein [Chaetomium globosum CBS 148.51]
MRNTILASLFLASATLTSASRLKCLQHPQPGTLHRRVMRPPRVRSTTASRTCRPPTHQKTLPSTSSSASSTQGCTSAESQIEALRVLGANGDNPNSDLRRGRRQFSSENSNGDASPFAAGAKEPLGARDPIAAGVTAAMYLPRHTGLAAIVGRQDQATAVTNERPSSPSPCFTDSSTEITTLPHPNHGRRVRQEALLLPHASLTTPNPPASTASSSRRSFAGAIVVAIGSICFLCCRERSEHRRTERAAEAARIAKEAKTQATVAAKRAGTSVTGGVSGPAVEGQPLMYQGGGGGPGPSSPGPQQQHFPQQGGYTAGNPFTDAGNDGHPMR